ncbi:MAG: valine--tRNA ligase [Erysipelotrichaceae bacterium]|nr:valine--tRNA ligase [Erysipelotrichaceae bacterium]
MKELNPKYDHKMVEEGKYKDWLSKDYFKCGDLNKKPFSIVIPPPNVTGKLHLGHAWDVTLQDLIARYKRMQGFDVLWLPGMDHAGIATQAKVEERLRKEGISRYDLGREKFLDQVWAWKEEYASTIRTQWAKMGVSVDYSKERFTLDQGLSKAVREVFVKLYNEGLIYRGLRIINWDPVQKTALSNIEVIHKEQKSDFFYFKYYLEGSNERYLSVATTRPETMYGDVAVVVNPKDTRFKDFVGKRVINPANGEPLIVIEDDYIDIEFGTGAMKCTPAHDPNDFLIGERHGLEKPICINKDGTVNELAGKYNGLDRFECRKKMVEEMDQKGLLIKIEKITNQVGHSERSDAVVEPYLSEQWFVKMKPLAEASLEALGTKKGVEFYPPRFEKIYRNWMEGAEDWCISRQLWWGHRIPAWYHKVTGEVYVGTEEPKDIENYIQDEDVLDTWFSSALWPFSTMGWPDTSSMLLKRYFPTDVLVTGYDIIFFWVSRMIFTSLKFMNNKPFKEVLIHGLIRDEQGRKMSKSLGNGVDPMDVIDSYGVDALRFFLITNSTPGQDMRYSDDKVKSAWGFINKIWNASRFVLMSLDDNYIKENVDTSKLSIFDFWILSKLNETIKEVTKSMEKYEFGIAGKSLYNFIYNDFCSWYIELSKVKQNNNTKNILVYLIETISKLLHPFTPFVSEEIYQTINGNDTSLNVASYPTVLNLPKDKEKILVATKIQEIISAVRNLRNENKIAPNKPIEINIVVEDDKLKSGLEDNEEYLERFLFASALYISKVNPSSEKAINIVLDKVTLVIPLKGLLDVEAEIKRLENEIAKVEKELARSKNILSNENFISKASPEKIAIEKEKEAVYQENYKKLVEKLNEYKNI